MSTTNTRRLNATNTDVVNASDDYSVDTKHNNDGDGSVTPGNDGDTPSTSVDVSNTQALLQLRPQDTEYSPLCDEDLDTIADMDHNDLQALHGSQPKAYDYVPEAIWIALTTGSKGLKDITRLTRSGADVSKTSNSITRNRCVSSKLCIPTCVPSRWTIQPLTTVQ